MRNTMTEQLPHLVILIRSELQRHADPNKAVEMQRYMKTTQPFYGVQSQLRKELFRQARKAATPGNRGFVFTLCTV